MAEKTSQRGSNLSREDRERGGRASAAKQIRDARGQFAGRKDGPRQQQRDAQQRSDQNQNEQVNQNDRNDEQNEAPGAPD
jgi:hypothetical protein